MNQNRRFFHQMQNMNNRNEKDINERIENLKKLQANREKEMKRRQIQTEELRKKVSQNKEKFENIKMNYENQRRTNEEKLRRIKEHHEELLRRFRIMMNNNFNFASRPISEEVLKKLNKFIFKDDVYNKNEINKKVNCCICLNDIKKNEEVVKLPCNHIHHWNCCVNWLRTKNVCPLCRLEIK